MATPDLAELARQVGTILTPFLPHLLKAAGTIGKSALEKIGEAGGEKVAALWDRLWPNIKKRPAAVEAVQNAAEMPDDERALAALSLQLEKVLAELEPDVLSDIQSTLSQISTETRVITASGKGAVAIGGNAIDTSIDTGDNITKSD